MTCVPVVVAHAQQERVLGDAGVGDEHLDGAVRLLDLGEGAVDVLGVGDVAAHGEEARRRLTAAVGDRDVVAEAAERLGDRAADAPVAPGHQHRSGHVRTPPGRSTVVADDARGYPWVPGIGARATPISRSVVLEAEADLEADLEVLDARRP